MAVFFVFTFLSVTVITKAQVFSTHPVDSTILQSGIVDFRCRLNGVYPCNNVHWVKYVGSNGDMKYRVKKYVSTCATLVDRRTFDETRYSVAKQNTNEYRLEIRDVQPNDAGDYGCIVYDTVTKASVPSGAATLIVLNSWPKPVCHANPSNANVGTTVRFTCTVPPGSPTLPLSWKYKQTIDFGGTKSVAPGESYDVVRRLRSTENYEQFTCFAGYGDAVNACTVSPLQIPPTPVVSPVVVRKLVGDNAEFTCNVVIDTPSIKSRVWFVVDGEQNLRRFRNSSGRYQVLDDNSLFRIQELTSKDNNTHVWCTARNEKGIYSAATGTARLVVIPKGTPIITVPVEETATLPPDDATTTSMDDISASDTLDDPGGHSAAVAGGTTAAIFLVLVVVALWMYMIKGRMKTMNDNLNGRLHSKNNSRPLTVMVSADPTYGGTLQMHAIEPPINTSRKSLFTSGESLGSRHDRIDYDIVGYSPPFPRADTLSRVTPMQFMSSANQYQHKTQTLPARHGRQDRKIHTVCLTYQDHRGSSLPGSPVITRSKTKRRGTTPENIQLDLKRRQAVFNSNGTSPHPKRTRSSHKLSRQEAVRSYDPRGSSLPNSSQTIRAAKPRRRNTNAEDVLYAIPLHNRDGFTRMQGSSTDHSLFNANLELAASRMGRTRNSSISKNTSKKRSFVNTLSLSELKLISSKKPGKLCSELKKRKNVEGLVYAELELNRSCSTDDKASIIGNEDRTVYADIRESSGSSCDSLPKMFSG